MFTNSRIFRKIIDSLNLSIIFFILLLSFVSLKSQREWTMFYSGMIELRNKNNNIIDYISKTEQSFLKAIENQVDIKNANPDDLLYLIKTKKAEKINFFSLAMIEMNKGFDDGKYQRGY
tara:strand:+ start:710 stop:1066 length:357 start_codon:yes stop_codon:yes gene_type:complete